MRWVLGCLLALAACGAAASTASGDGLPVPFDGGDNTGVRSHDGNYSYATAAAGANTVVLRIATGTGEIQRSIELHGDYGVPLVAYDGTPSGLSANGETLVLIRPRVAFPRRTTEFAILDAERLRLREELTLEGDFSFDALSPDGRLMYLIRYPDPRDPTAYEVRAYDLERSKLLPDPIVDPNESGEEMAGFPQTRATSPDGRWAYTLYEPAERDHPPFIHALDTQRGTAVCIDLDPLADQRGIWRLGLQPSVDGSSLAVVDRGSPVALVDLGDFQVSEPETPAPAAETDGEGPSWAVLGAGTALLFVAGSVVVVHRRRRSAPGSQELERLVAVEDDAAGPDRSEADRGGDRECEPVR
jgi:hypothetical protein